MHHRRIGIISICHMMARDSITRATQPILMDELAHYYLFIDRRLTSTFLTCILLSILIYTF